MHDSLVSFLWGLIFTIGEYNKDLSKMVYLQNRRFLPEDRVLRRQTFFFPSKQQEKRKAPPKKTWAESSQFQAAFDNSSK